MEMKSKIAGIFLLSLSTMSIQAKAAANTAVSVYYFNSANQLIGQSLRYCPNNQVNHIGTAQSTNRNKISIFYTCPDGNMTMTFDIGVPSTLKNDFCAVYQVCADGMPTPIRSEYLNYPIENGFYSN